MKVGLSLGYSGRRLVMPVEHVQLAERLGYDSVWTAEAYGSDAITPLAYLGAVTERIQELFLSGRKEEATAAVPDELIDEEALIGPKERIAKRFEDWSSSGATGLKISTADPEAMELMAKLAS